MDARPDNIPAREQRAVVLPSPVRMELLAIVTMVPIAIWLPSASTTNASTEHQIAVCEGFARLH